MAQDSHLLRHALCDPARLTQLHAAQWDLLVRQARRAGLAARLWNALADGGRAGDVPEGARRHLEAARIVAERRHEALRWEIGRILEAMDEAHTPAVFLKGAAYVAAGLPAARGRIFGDIDILVPRQNIEAAERALMHNGWAPMKINAYDQRYYRKWMHEIPPLEHVRRQSVIDVHHNILPLTARYHPDAGLLLQGAQPSPLDPRARVLAPADMVLHCTTHLFHEGETDRALRDLFDLDSLLRHFGSAPEFWDSLCSRAHALDLARPLFYGLRYAARLIGTPVPHDVFREIQHAQPAAPARLLMDWMSNHGFRPNHATCADALTPLAQFLIYVRGHWLRMPPRLLVPHLLHKALPRREEKPAS